MWHVSIASRHLSDAALRRLARDALYGVGDASRGEWHEITESRGVRFYHIKRRLSAAEDAQVGPAVDIRGTPEYDARIAACPWLPAGWMEGA